MFKKLFISALLALVVTFAIAQEEIPAWASDHHVLIEDDYRGYIDDVTELELTPESANTPLLTVKDNSEEIYLRPPFTQGGFNSCVSASSVAYTFTYEISRLRNIAVNDPNIKDNWYPTHYTYNPTHVPAGSPYFMAWEIIKNHGCPKLLDWEPSGAMYNNATDPMKIESGYDFYMEAMKNRVESIWKITWTAETMEDKLNIIKHWINDHNEGDDVGGVLVMPCLIHTDGNSSDHYKYFDPQSPHSDKKFVYQWGNAAHAMTVVGYDDEVYFDFDGNGQITNDGDMANWEQGALKIINSYGGGWVNGGFVYVPYRMLADPNFLNQFPGYDAFFCGIYAMEEEYVPEIYIKSALHYPLRNLIRSEQRQYAENAGGGAFNDYLFYQYGGEYQINGFNDDPVELIFDIGDFEFDFTLAKTNFWTFYHPDQILGEITHMELVDNRFNETFIILSEDIPHPIISSAYEGGFKENSTYIKYGLIPFEINEDYMCQGYIYDHRTCRKTITVSNNSQFKVYGDEDPSKPLVFNMYNCDIIVEEGSELNLDYYYTNFLAKEGTNRIIINGDLVFGDLSPQVNFIAEEGATLEVIINSESFTIIDEVSNFINSSLTTTSKFVTINNVNFTNSFLHSTHFIWANTNDFTLSSCIFNGSHSTEHNALYIDNFLNIDISSNTFTDLNNGIYLSYCGNADAVVSDNTITNCSGKGLIVYHSDVDIYKNHIHDNGIGVAFYDYSQSRLIGDINAEVCQETQLIANNESYEIFATKQSFPIKFFANAIVDEDNPEPLVYYQILTPVLPIDVRNNYWGENFNYIEDLYPSNSYNFTPIWDLDCVISEPNSLEELFDLSVSESEQGNTETAISMFKDIIQEYPDSEYAAASINELFKIEKNTRGDLNTLKDYLRNNETIMNNELLFKVADFYANKCDIELMNWQDAIEWFENVINDPDDLTEQILAIIDLERTYLLMDNNSRSNFTGKLTEYKPKSIIDFNKDRDYFISLLPGEQINDNLKSDLMEMCKGKLLQNIPNPFSFNTQIWYKLEEEANVSIDIFNFSGAKVNSFNLGLQTGGVHSFDFNASDLYTGIYLYTLKVNGNISDTKKMTITR